MSGREFFRYSGCLVLILFMVLLGTVVIYMLMNGPWVQPETSGSAGESTGESTNATRDPATQVTTAPTEQTTQPTEQTTAPTEETTAPTEETTAPTEETTAPTEETTAPTEETTAPTEPAADGGMAAVALAQVGKLYSYGGDNPEDGFDTTGLVYYCARQCGYNAPRSWNKQIEYGRRVEKDELQPGDVVYFWLNEEGTEDYVGIYVGDGKFVAARNAENPVSLMDLTNSYFGPRLMYGRRYE